MTNNFTRPTSIVSLSLALIMSISAPGSARAEGPAKPGQKCRYDFASRAMVCDQAAELKTPPAGTPSASTATQADGNKAGAKPPELVRVQGLPRGTYLEVRSRPNSGAPITAYIPPDSAPFNMLGCPSVHWCRVQYQDQTGYARRHFLARVKKSAPHAAPLEERQAAISDVLLRVVRVPYDDTLNVRQFPSMDSPVVGELPADARRIVLRGDCQDDWCPIEYGQVVGWAGRYYLTRDR